MSKTIIIFCLTIATLFVYAFAADPDQKLFISDYVAAVNGKDVDGLKRLVHPKCLACINNENQDYFDDYFSREIRETIPDTYRITNITPIGNAEPLLMAEAFSYPVRPTHWVQFDFARGAYDSKSILRQIVKVEDAWFMVVPCPTPDTVKRFRQAKIAKEKQKERAKVLFEKLNDPLLSELKKLLAEGKKVQALKRYSSVTGESLSMAKKVVALLKEMLTEIRGAEFSPQAHTPEWALADIGKPYAGLEDLKKDQQSKGYVFIGRFGNSWPAEIKEVTVGMDEISFERDNGQKHKYTGFNGYEMVLLRLRSINNQNENVVIFRSKEKK